MDFNEFLRQVIDRGLWFSAGHIFVIITTLTLGTLAYKRNPHSSNNRSFVLTNFCFSMFAVSMYASDFIFLPHDTLLTIVRTSFVTGLFGGISILNFCLTFPEQRKDRPWHFKLVIIISPFLVYLYMTDLLIKNITIDKFAAPALTAQFGPLYMFAFLIFFWVVLASPFVLFLKVRRLKGRARAQAQFILFGLILFGMAIFITNLIPQLFGGIGLSRYGALNTLFFIGFTAYAMIRHRLMDIRMVVFKSFVYALTTSLVVITLVIALFLITGGYRGFINQNIINITTMLFLLAVYNPLRKFIEDHTDKLFFKGRYKFQDLLAKINQIVAHNSRSVSGLTSGIMNALAEDMKASRSAFILAAPGGISVKNHGFNSRQKSLWSQPVKFAQEASNAVILDEFEEESKVRAMMSQVGAEVLVPIRTTGKTEAVLALGEKKSGDMYNAQDLKLLELAAPQIAIALENARLYEQAVTDSLTGLYHHKYFQVMLEKELERSKRFGYPLSLIMLDIDFFKSINDKHGHQIGDQVLIELSNLVKHNVRGFDLVCRYGGEEFVVLMPVIRKNMIKDYRQAVEAVAKRLRKTIEDNLFTEKKLKITASLGMLVFDGQSNITAFELVEKADLLLYKAKDGGRNTICSEFV